MRQWLAVDPTSGPAGGALYVAWATRRAAGHGQQEGVAFSRSLDGGRSFTAPRLISVPPGGVTAPVIAAGPGGAVYVAYVTSAARGAAFAGQTRMPSRLTDHSVPRARAATPTLAVEVVASVDHGRSFGQPVALGPAVFGLSPQPGLLLPSGPMLGTDHRTGALYVAYVAMRPASGQPAITLARSLDSGKTWSTSTPVPPASLRDHAVAFQPQVVVAASGTVAVSYLQLAHGRVDLLMAQSVAPGARFGLPRRITTRSFDPALGLPGDKEGLWWIGDYQALAAGPRSLHPCWGDTRTGHLQIFTATIPAAR